MIFKIICLFGSLVVILGLVVGTIVGFFAERIKRGIVGGIIGGGLGAGVSWLIGLAIARSQVPPVHRDHMGGGALALISLVFVVTAIGMFVGTIAGAIVAVAGKREEAR